MMLNAGQVIAGRYEIIEQIGSGGMAIVYRAKDMKLDRFVTVKVLREEHISNDEFRQRFQVEARAIASLNHPNIVNVYDVGNENSINYIVMEYIDGVTLKELITKRAPFGDDEVIGVSIQVAAALSHAHKNGVIHRDIKPQNILVTPNGTIKVTDFGIARSANSNTMPIGGSTMGSVHYISPEQAKGEAINAKSDLYAIGILMYEMVTGALPYDADNSVSIALMHINDPLPSIRKINANISKNTEGIIHHLTEKDPNMRYQNADSLIYDLKIALSDQNITSYGEQFNDEEYIVDSELEDDFDLDDFDLDDYDDGEVVVTDKSLEKKVYLAGVLTAVAIIIIIVMIVLPMITRDKVELVKVPNIIGMDFDEASKVLSDLGLVINKKDEVSSETFKENEITDQTYKEEDKVKAGTSIDVFVSTGTSKLEVPDLTKLELSAAYDKKGRFKIVEGSYENSDTIARNVIISQVPKAGEFYEAGTEIKVIISAGPKAKMVTVPDVVGMTEAAAKTILQGKGFSIGLVGTEASEKYAEGLVSTQLPTAGKEVLDGATIVLRVSSGLPVASPPPTDEPGGTTPTSKTYSLKCAPYIEEGIESVLFTVSKKTQDGFIEIYSKHHLVSDFPLFIPVSDIGVVEYHMLVDGNDRGSGTVDFNKLTTEANNE